MIGVMQNTSSQIPGPDGELALWNGDASRLHVRKAQYHYGWDWGPVLMCVGPWKHIRLEAYTLRISETRVNIDMAESGVHANIRADLEGDIDPSHTIAFKIVDPTGFELNITSELSSSGKLAEGSVRIPNPQLWYPIGYGNQPLYCAIVEVSSGDSLLATTQRRIGLRSVRVVQKSLEGDHEGKSFFFEVNGASIFCGGAFLFKLSIGSDMKKARTGFLLIRS